jgi:hypothetical protein
MTDTARKMTTCHHSPWALIRRAGDAEGKRQSTRMAYLVGTVVPKGEFKAVAMTGYIMNSDMTGWTRSVRRIEWGDVVKRWNRQPTVAEVQKAKRRMPVVTVEAIAACDASRRADCTA